MREGGSGWASGSLWGGAASAELPHAYEDASAVRPVPDHQELRCCTRTGQGVSLEVLESDPARGVGMPGGGLCGILFADQAELNGAALGEDTTVVREEEELDMAAACPGVAADDPAAAGAWMAGRIRMPFGARDTVEFAVACLRLPRADSDLAVVVYMPLHPDTLVPDRAVTADADAAAVLARVLKTLRVHDWGLFG